jgi:hypothetical protein
VLFYFSPFVLVPHDALLPHDALVPQDALDPQDALVPQDALDPQDALVPQDALLPQITVDPDGPGTRVVVPQTTVLDQVGLLHHVSVELVASDAIFSREL